MNMTGMICLEGADGTGKSYLAASIRTIVPNTKYLHLTYRHRDSMVLYHLAALRFALKYKDTHLVIIDRWWPSERVYANEFRGGSKWPFMGESLNAIFTRMGGIYVYCVPNSVSQHVKEFDHLKTTRKEMYQSVEGIVNGYEKLFDSRIRGIMLLVRYCKDIQGKMLHNFIAFLNQILSSRYPTPSITDEEASWLFQYLAESRISTKHLTEIRKLIDACK